MLVWGVGLHAGVCMLQHCLLEFVRKSLASFCALCARAFVELSLRLQCLSYTETLAGA